MTRKRDVMTLGEAIRDWAAHQDCTQRGNKRRKGVADRRLACSPDLTGLQGAVAELYRLQQHSYKSEDIGISPRRREFLKDLLQQGMDPAEADATGDTLLHHLCRHDAPMADMRQLFQYGAGAVINIQNAVGETPLLAHVRSAAPIQGVLQLLLANGADPAIADNDGVTPMMALQVKSPHMPTVDKLADLLEHHGKSPTPGQEEAVATPNIG